MAEHDRAGARVHRPPTCGPHAVIGAIAEALEQAPDGVVVVVSDHDDVVLGTVHANAADLPAGTPVLDAAHPAPPTVRPSITRYELARSMDEAGQRHILVTTSHGVLIGIVDRHALDT